jgi:hypothetical protein
MVFHIMVHAQPIFHRGKDALTGHESTREGRAIDPASTPHGGASDGFTPEAWRGPSLGS